MPPYPDHQMRKDILEYMGWTDLKSVPARALRGTSPAGVRGSLAPNPLINLNVLHELLKSDRELREQVEYLYKEQCRPDQCHTMDILRYLPSYVAWVICEINGKKDVQTS